MRRNATGLIGGTVLLSMLAAPPPRAATDATAPATSRAGQEGTRPGAAKRATVLSEAGPAWGPDDFAAHGRREAAQQLARLFLDVCRETQAPAKDVAPAGPQEISGKTPWEEELFLRDPGALPDMREWQAKVKTVCSQAGSPLSADDFVIAVVPDPVHTRLALDFDRMAEVIQEALQDAGYWFVKAHLPWDPKAHPESDDPAHRLEARADADAREDLPGLLAFRRAAKTAPQSHLLVLVVGESPTRGINRRQFLQAIDWIQHTTSNEPSAPGSAPTAQRAPPGTLNLRILGPTFSGSLASLSQLLHTAAEPASPAGPNNPFPLGRVHIFSGTISSSTAVADFRRSLEEPGTAENGVPSRQAGAPAVPPLARPATAFISFQETDDVMIERFREYLAAANQPSRSLAILSEDETAYGSVATATERTLSSCPLSTDPSQLESGRGCLYLYFPREISRLRAAYQASGIGSAPSGAQSAPRDVLPLNLEISGADNDTIAAFSKQNAMSQEGVLLDIVSQLRSQAIKYVVLRATDPLDLLFLSRYLAAAYPKARIVTIGADLLFRREAEDKQLHGTLALSTYSLALFANREFADSREHAEHVFPSSLEAGSYNALRALLAVPAAADLDLDPVDHDRYRLESTCPLHLYQYGWFESWHDGRRCRDFAVSNTPPVHLLALGRDEYWPIAHLGPIPAAPIGSRRRIAGPASTLPEVSVSQFVKHDRLSYRAPTSWVAAELIALLLALGFAGSLWYSSNLSPNPILVQLAPAGAGSRDSLILAATVLLTAILLILLFPFVAGGSTWRIEGGKGLQLALWLALGVMLPVVLVDLYDRHRASGDAGTTPPSAGAREDRRVGGRRLPWAILALVAGLVVAAGGRRAPPPPRGGGGRGAPLPTGAATSRAAGDTSGAAGGAGLRWRRLLHGSAALALLAGSVAGWVWMKFAKESPYGTWRHVMVRSLQLTSGLAPILPMLLLIAAGLWWAFQTSAGSVLLDDRRRPPLPKGVHGPRVRIVAEQVADDPGHGPTGRSARRGSFQEDNVIVTSLLHTLRLEWTWEAASPYLASLAVCLAAPLLMGLLVPLMTVERGGYGLIFWYCFLAPVLMLISGTTLRLWDIWSKTRRLLTMLDSLPLRRGFQDIKDFSWQPLWRLGLSGLPEAQRIAARLNEARQCAEATAPEAFSGAHPGTSDADRRKMMEVWEDILKIRHPYTRQWSKRRGLEIDLINLYRDHQEGHAFAAGRALDYLAEQWPQDKEAPRRKQRREKHDELARRALERFVCLLYVSFLRVVMERMRSMMMAIGGMYILVLVAMTSYPFQPRATIVTVLAMLLLYILTVVTLVFAQAHRDATLSHITDTTPGELGGDFWLKTLSYAALPLFTLVVSQFPQLNSFLYSWLEPAVRALSK